VTKYYHCYKEDGWRLENYTSSTSRMTNFGAINLSEAGVEGRNIGALAYLVGGTDDKIRQFPDDTILRAKMLGQHWNPTIDAENIPSDWISPEKRDEYIRAWMDYANSQGNTEPLFVGGLFNSKGKVISPWIRYNASRGEQKELIADIAKLAREDGRGTILQLPRDFRLSATNADKILTFLKEIDPPVTGLSIYPLGSTRAEIEQFFLTSSEKLPGVSIDYYGLAKRPSNRVSVQEALEIILPAQNGGIFYFDSWIRGGDDGNFNVDPGAEFLIQVVFEKPFTGPTFFHPSPWYLNTMLSWAQTYAATH